MRRILAIGGGGFLMEDAASPIDAHIVQLTGKPRPRICFVGTPSDCQWSSNNPQLWSSNLPHPSTPRSERWKRKSDRPSSRMMVAQPRARGPGLRGRYGVRVPGGRGGTGACSTTVKWLKAVERADAKMQRKSGIYTTTHVRASLDGQPRTVAFLEKAFGISVREHVA